MASLSRFVLKDYNLHIYDAVRRRPWSLMATDVRAGISVPENGNSWAMQSKPSSPLVALAASSSIIPASRVLKNDVISISRNSKVMCKSAANVSGDIPTPSGMNQYERIIETLTTLFPVWVCRCRISCSILNQAYARICYCNDTETFCSASTGLIILVSCCPDGQASNVATYISKGNVALSVLMTMCSTIGAIVMTPPLTKLLAGQLVPVDAAGLAISTLFGVLSNEFFPKFTSKIISVTPLIGVILTTLLCASPISKCAAVFCNLPDVIHPITSVLSDAVFCFMHRALHLVSCLPRNILPIP
ncbi:hypothetical protein CRYUN_Cryun02cG0001400 [Craigia yunnanensis]